MCIELKYINCFQDLKCVKMCFKIKMHDKSLIIITYSIFSITVLNALQSLNKLKYKLIS